MTRIKPPEIPLYRVVALIDGFNYYHRIDEYQSKTGVNLKWLNYRSLIESKLHPNQRLEKVVFFTAIDQKMKQPKILRHKSYINALQSQEIEVVLGQFNYPSVTCKNCNYVYRKPTEKRTDVNIAIRLLEGAFQDEYDTCFIFSGDTDLIPAIEAVRRLKPEKRVVAFPPPDYYYKNEFNYTEFC